MVYSLKAYKALALFLRETIEESRLLDPEFEVGVSDLGDTKSGVDIGRGLNACREFYNALEPVEKQELVGDAMIDHEDDFLDSSFSYIWHYLCECADFRREATEVLKNYLSAIDAGHAEDQANIARNDMPLKAIAGMGWKAR